MADAPCPSREKLREYSVGLLSEEQSDDLARHLNSCGDCQATIVALEDADDTLVGRLRTPLSTESCLDEPQLQAAVAKAMTTPVTDFEAQEVSDSGSKPAAAMPQALGEYQLLEELGSGGMGRVYKALHTKLDRVVAVKVLPRGRLGDPQAISRFEREMRAVGRLAHPNIVQAYDAREIEGTPVLIMEFVDGLDLAAVVRRLGPLPVAEACQLTRQTAVALVCAHQHGLIHRDIKPSNIMLARSGEVKLLDLGLARFYAEGGTGVSPVSAGEEMTGTGQAMGTADYMAPEQASDSRTVDIRADIYSLGCTLYKLLSGRAPFGGPEHRGTLEKMHAHVHQTAPPIRQFAEHVPEELAAIVDRMLAKDPADRFATPAEVAAALEPFCAGADLIDLAARAAADEGRGTRGEGRATSEGKGDADEERAEGPAAGVRNERPPTASAGEPPGASTGETPVPPTAPIRRRPIIWLVLIGLVFFGGMALAFAAGVLITIKRNGQTYQVEVPAESHTVVEPSGNVTVNLSGKPEAGQSAAVNPVAQLKALQGQWKVVRVEKAEGADSLWSEDDGTRGMKPEGINRIRFDQQYLAILDLEQGESWHLEYSIDPTAEPKTIDVRQPGTKFTSREGPVATGIYEVNGDRLKICLAKYLSALKTERRPRRFAVAPGSGDLLLTLERHQPSQDERAIEGYWAVMSTIADGETVAEKDLQNKLFSFCDSLVTYGTFSHGIYQHDQKFGLYDLDPGKQPKAISLVYRTPREPEKLPGIYQFEGDRLSIAYRKGGPRPEKFESPPGSGITLLTLRRKKPEEATPEAGEPAAAEAPARKPEGKQAPAISPAAEPKAPTTATEPPSSAGVNEYKDFSGETEAAQNARIAPSVSGQLLKIDFQDSQQVKRGELLFELDSKPYQTAVKKAEAEWERARAELAVAEAEIGRNVQANKSVPNVVPKREIEKAAGQVTTARTAVGAAMASLEAARANLDATRIKSPLDGRPGRTNVNVGEWVQPGTALTTIVGEGPIHVNFNVDEKTYRQFARQWLQDRGPGPIEKLRIPVAIGLADEDGFPHQGVIDFIDNQAGSGNMIRFRALLANAEGTIMPGLGVRVRIPLKRPPAAGADDKQPLEPGAGGQSPGKAADAKSRAK